MTYPYIGEIRAFSLDLPPKGWELCNGQELPIYPNMILYSVIGNRFGGDGVTTFALPNLKGRFVTSPQESRQAREARSSGLHASTRSPLKVYYCMATTGIYPSHA